MSERVNLGDVARRAGVSPATVSRVLNGNYPVAEATRRRVLKAVSEFDYVLNAHARALMHDRSGTVGIILADVSDPFFAEIVRGVQRVARSAERLAVICNTEGDPAMELSYLKLLRNQRADAVIIVGAGTEDPEIQAELARAAGGMARQGAKLIFCGRPSPTEAVTAPSVQADNVRAGRLAVKHVLSVGHRSLLYLGGPLGMTTTTDRLRGFRAGARTVRGVLAASTIKHGPLDRATGYALTVEALDEGLPCTAILTANDLMAAGVLACLRDRGVRVPEDISVVGIDDLPLCEDLSPRLTTVSLPLPEMGARAMRLALDSGEDECPEESPLAIRLVERDSVRPQ